MQANEELGMSLHMTSGIQSSKPVPGMNYSYMFDNGVAVINLIGPIYPRANMMTMSGATSLQQYTKEFVSLHENPAVTGILQYIDSPGGDARGLGDAANLIYGYTKKQKKPVRSFAAGYMASAAYYLGAASQRITGSKGSSYVGSIGTVLSARALSPGNYEIVSSQSPLKRADPSTEEGMASLQQMVDDLGQIFVEDVATFRGVSVDKVLSDYGQGAVLIGPRAKKAGLVDDLGTFDSVIEQMVKDVETKSYRRTTSKKVSANVAEIITFTEEEKLDMGLKDLVTKFAPSNETIFDSEDEQAQPQNVTPEEQESEEGATNEAQGQPQIQLSREQLEDQFVDSAELFATQMMIDNRIFPAFQAHAASDLLIAKIDDKLVGGKVTYIGAEGDVIEGTREEAVRARYAATPKHTMTQKAIKGIKDGTVKGVVLKEEVKEESKDADDTAPTAERKEYLLSQSNLGQSVLAQKSGR